MICERNALTFASWNLKGGLSDASRALDITDRICDSRPDFIALPDAWHEDSSRSRPSGRRLLVSPRDFERDGYSTVDTHFEEDRPDANFARFHLMCLISNNLDYESSVTRLGARPAVTVDTVLGKAALSIIGIYLNDQTEHNRLMQISSLKKQLAHTPNKPTLLVGDFNAMPRESRIAALLQRRTSSHTLSKVNFFNRTLPRLVEMADGATMATLTDIGFSDCDPSAAPTMHSRARLFQLDHILTKGFDEAGLAASTTQRIFYPRLSDHAMIWTKVSAVIHPTIT